MQSEAVRVKKVREGESGLPVKSIFKLKRGESGAILDPEVCANIGVELLAQAKNSKLIRDGVTAGFFYTIMHRVLIDQLRYYTAFKRVRKTTEGDKEIGYDDVPGMNNLVYSGGDEEE